MQVQRFVYVQGDTVTAITGAAANVFSSVGTADEFTVTQVTIAGLPPTAPQTAARIFALVAAQALAPTRVSRVVVCAPEQDIGVAGLLGIPVEFTAEGPREVTTAPEPLVFWISWLGGGERPTPTQMRFAHLFGGSLPEEQQE